MGRLTADKPVRLVSLPGLLLMLVVILGVLYLLVPKRAVFEDPSLLKHPDSLSIAYLKAVLRSDPGRNDIRLALVQELIRLGKLREAEAILRPLPEHPRSLGLTKKLLQMKIMLLQLQATSDPRRAEIQRSSLLSQLQELPLERLPTEKLLETLEMGRDLGAGPAILSRIGQALAHTEPERAAHWWTKAGDWALAAGDPLSAARHYRSGALAADTPQQARELATRALDAALMAAKPGLAFSYLEEFLQRWPEEETLLQRGIKIALATSNLPQALEWNTRHLSLHPGDVDALRRQRDISLALGSLPEGLHWAQAVVRHPKATMEDRGLLAQVLEWNGKPRQALQAWQALEKSAPSPGNRQQVIRLARMLGDLQTELAMLRRLEENRPLERDESWRKAELEEGLGEPEQAEKTLARYLSRHPNEIRFWQRRLQLAEEMGDFDLQLRILDQQALLPGNRQELIRRKARVLWMANREAEAWSLLQSLSRPFDNASLADLEIYGELAWRTGALEQAFALYRHLYVMTKADHSPKEWDRNEYERVQQITLERLVLLADRQGDSRLAMKAAREGWRTWKNENLLLQAMRLAMRRQQWAMMDQLAHEVLEQGTDPRLASRLLVLLAAAQRRQNQGPKEVARLYRLALQLDPGSHEARLGLLWLYVDTQEPDRLRHLLPQWQQAAAVDSRYWPVYAAGWELLGKPRAALPWYHKQLARTPSDPLWLFNYADLLDQLDRRADAWKIRRHALALLQPRLRERPAAGDRLETLRQQLLLALERELGRPRLQPGVEQAALEGRVGAMFLASWELSRERDDRARRWLALRHVRRVQLPAWERLSLALLENDQQRIDRLLQEDRLALLDRVRAEERLGRYDPALSHALLLVDQELSADVRQAATQWAASLYHRLPTSADIGLGWTGIGKLDVHRQAVGGRISRRNLSLHLSLARERLEIPSSIYDLKGRDHEQQLVAGLEWWGPANRLSLDLGLRRRDDGSLPYALMAWEHRLTERNRLRLSGVLNDHSDATQIVRADTVVDRLRLEWQSDLTPRISFQLGLDHHHLTSRENSRLADGELAEFAFIDKQMLGTNELNLRLQGSWLNNRLADRLPPEMASRMPPGSSVSDVIDERYSSLGIGAALARGEPQGRAPLVGGLRYQLDGWIGWEWPADQPAFGFSAAAGGRVLGSDELSLSYYYNSSTLNIGSGQSSQGLWLRYRYFFGH